MDDSIFEREEDSSAQMNHKIEMPGAVLMRSIDWFKSTAKQLRQFVCLVFSVNSFILCHTVVYEKFEEI